jgi:hypothetical protein
MENLPKNSENEPVEEKPEVKTPEEELNKTAASEEHTPKINRKNDFTHTHPDHAHHRSFGLDHEPGAF